MDTGAAFGCVETEAERGVRVVRDPCPSVGVDGSVGFARRYDLDAAGGEQRTQTDAERKIGCLLERSAGQVCAGIVTAVSRVEDDDKAG